MNKEYSSISHPNTSRSKSQSGIRPYNINGNGSGNTGNVKTTGTFFKKIVFTKNTNVDSIITKLNNEISKEQTNFKKKKEIQEKKIKEKKQNKYNVMDNKVYTDNIKSILDKYLSLTPCRKREYFKNYYFYKGNLKNNNEKDCEIKKLDYYKKIKNLNTKQKLLVPVYKQDWDSIHEEYSFSVINEIINDMNEKLENKIISHQGLINKYIKQSKTQSTTGGKKTVKKPVKKPTTKKPVKKTTTKKPTTKKPVKKTTTKKTNN